MWKLSRIFYMIDPSSEQEGKLLQRCCNSKHQSSVFICHGNVNCDVIHYYTVNEQRADSKPHQRAGGGGRNGRKNQRGCVTSMTCTISAAPPGCLQPTSCVVQGGTVRTRTESTAELFSSHRAFSGILQPEEGAQQQAREEKRERVSAIKREIF